MPEISSPVRASLSRRRLPRPADETSYYSCGITFLDPVPDLLDGNAIITAPSVLATLGTQVWGIAADGAARVVLRIPAHNVGERFQVTLSDDGWLSSVNGSEVTTQFTAVSAAGTAMAFAVYHAPPDFSRGGDEDNLPSRQVNFTAASLDFPDFAAYGSLTVYRPPVVLVHGLWGGPADWNGFTPFLTDARFFIGVPCTPWGGDDESSICVTSGQVAYNYSVAISASSPGYDQETLANSRANSLGFAFNAWTVLRQIKAQIKLFRQTNQAAATRVDVVAHSMGGMVTCTLLGLPDYTGTDSFGQGNIHKLITIGTPHLGSPLATHLIKDSNPCVRNVLAHRGRPSYYTATVSGVASPPSGTCGANSEGSCGGVGDLQGDGVGGYWSIAISNLASIQNAVPTAMIAGSATSSNLASLDSSLSFGAWYIRSHCPGNQLAASLTSQGWPTTISSRASPTMASCLSAASSTT